MIRKISATIIAALVCYGTALAQTDDNANKKTALKFSGSADVYVKYDMLKNPANTYTSFTKSHSSFELGMVSGKVEHQGNKVSFVGDIGFGKRVEQFTYNDNKSQIMIKQLYLTYSPASFLKLSMGSWGTHVGYELVDPYLNRNYSMSYMFSYGPFFHTGLKADFAFGQHAFMVGLTNPTDLKSALSTSTKYFIGQYSYTTGNGNFKSYFNLLAGKQKDDSLKVSQLDVVMTQKVNDHFSLGLNATVSNSKYDVEDTKKWWGTALYVNYDAAKLWGATLRTEYFNDSERLNVFSNTASGGSVLSNTLSLNFKLSALTIVPEMRYEYANKPIFSNLEGGVKNHDTNFLLAAVYQF
ncbi:outer membrane beta-barrel protein [Solitalea koreensis]|uniref:Beta-barrel porin-2, OmpL-like. bbp2 n=1 Tax=Solitalea koreensis TaxID=543615 RepID=A0A521EHL8_9SPHI|nr:outer membrane beta-barrel protein [Solitalea koreensis]SMO83342.1 Putative beta-barrel porin-2, OmpL-like. bbp2 [Solitalea koreensis]